MARKRSKCRNKKGRIKEVNLKKQMMDLIEKNSAIGTSKRSEKYGGRNKSKTAIYSEADKRALQAQVSVFAAWMKENHGYVKKIEDIKTAHYQGFLNDKAKVATTATEKTYKSRLQKLDRIFSKDVSNYSRQAKSLAIPRCKEQTRSMMMEKEHFNIIKELAYKPRRSENIQKALEIAGRTGCRVSEIAKLQARDYNEKKGTLNIVDSKGGRSRTIKIKEADRPYFEHLKSQCTSATERFVKIQHESINTGVRRLLKEAGLTQYIDNKTSVHAIRKMVAQDLYDEQKALGKEGIEAFNPVSEYLGHGEGRYDLYRAYIKRP